MNTLSFRLGFYILFCLLASSAVGFKAYLAIDKYFYLQDQMVLGKEVIKYVDKIKVSKFRESSLKNLQKYRDMLDQESRRKNFNSFIQAYVEKNSTLKKSRVAFFKKSENNYKVFVDKQLPDLKQQFLYYSTLTIGILVISFFSLYFILKFNLIFPMKDLNNKMIDFLNHKYTYQFIVPKNDEVGSLQATFNSLAQQVLANIDSLKDLDKAKSEFLSIASHELRTPLTSIKGSLSLLKQGVAGPLDESVLKLVSIADEETDRLIRLINDILDLTKLEAKKLSFKEEWVPLEPLITKIFESLDGLATTAGVKLNHTLSAPYLVKIDSDRIQQVLTNLISNSIKYSPTEGTVYLTAARNDIGHLMISVKDEGPGIAPEDQELIFQKFRQATNKENPLVKGTGLGLAIAKGLVEQHGGKIGLESSPGLGSTFFFTLPNWKLDMSESSIRPRDGAA